MSETDTRSFPYKVGHYAAFVVVATLMVTLVLLVGAACYALVSWAFGVAA